MKLTHGIPNFAQVDAGLWRGGQPTSSDSWLYLKSIGVGRVIKLNTEPENLPPNFGLLLRSFPINTVEQIIGPCGPQLESAYNVIQDGTFIHCHIGANRTGALVILYRMRVCGWSKWRSILEAYRYGWWDTLPALRAYIVGQ